MLLLFFSLSLRQRDSIRRSGVLVLIAGPLEARVAVTMARCPNATELFVPKARPRFGWKRIPRSGGHRFKALNACWTSMTFLGVETPIHIVASEPSRASNYAISTANQRRSNRRAAR